MENDEIAQTIGLVVLLFSLAAGGAYGTYRYGRFAERRLLTEVFMQMTSDTYGEGRMDGYKEGFVAGKKAKEREINEEDAKDRPSFSGRY